MTSPSLSPVDGVEVTVLADNYTDMFMTQDTPLCRRPKFMPPQTLLAEHGFSCVLKVRSGEDEQVVLMDAGVNPACVLHNASLLKTDLKSVDAIALSHGHPDHFLGLSGVLPSLKKDVPLMLHPDAFLERRMNVPAAGKPVPIPRLDASALLAGGAVPQTSRHPRTIADGMVLMTGEVERKVPFEKGFPWAEAKIDGEWVVDPFNDDQALVVNVRDRGLVVISGCAHAGIINTVAYAKKVTGVERVHAVLGGFHLTGPLFGPVIGPTVEAMKEIGPDAVVPMHCTGWTAITRFMEDMPGRCLLNTVGTTYTF
jgi:7,8-dihydropterin-6-yl-methyl-4-(beta-D-ribofuranosyl)aminobenzene 5'-phosphate synthase